MSEITSIAKLLWDGAQSHILKDDIKTGKTTAIINEVYFNLNVLDEFTRHKDTTYNKELTTVILSIMRHSIFDEYLNQAFNFKKAFSDPMRKDVFTFYRKLIVLQAIISNIEKTGLVPKYEVRLRNLRKIAVKIISESDKTK